MYTLQAIIAPLRDLKSLVTDDIKAVDLSSSWGMVPIDSHIQELLCIPFLPLTDEGVAEVPIEVVSLFRNLERGVYVEAEFFGGDGIQAGVHFVNGEQRGEVILSEGAINEVLRLLGVNRLEQSDEFTTLGLDRERSTDKWIVR